MKDRLQVRKIKCIRVEIVKIKGHSRGWVGNPASGGPGKPPLGPEKAGEEAGNSPHLEKKIDVPDKNGVFSCLRKVVQLRDD
jgi:hypothetical protein